MDLEQEFIRVEVEFMKQKSLKASDQSLGSSHVNNELLINGKEELK